MIRAFFQLWCLPQKYGYRPKPEFYRRGFSKFDCLVLAPNTLIGSENWLVCLSYDQESIPKVLYFFGVFLCSKMKEIQCLIMPQLRVWMLPQNHGYRPKTNYLFIIYFAQEYSGKVQNAFAIINQHMESCIWGLCTFCGHFWGKGHLLRACKLKIWPEILGAGLGMLKHKTRRVSGFLGHIYTTGNFTSLFSALAFSQNSTQDFFHYFMWKRRVFPPKKEKKRQTRFLDDNHVFVAKVTIYIIVIFNLDC